MNLKKTAAKATVVGAMSFAAVGIGAGLSHADPVGPPPPPWPVPAPDGPGANIGGPGNPAPPGHGGPMPNAAPLWAPPAPPSPPWAPWLPVQWSWEANAWGVYTSGGFQPL